MLSAPLGVPGVTTGFLCRVLADEMAWRKEHGLDTAALRSYYRALFSDSDRTIPERGVHHSLDGYRKLRHGDVEETTIHGI